MPRYAAIDIGSNSIRMEAAEVAPEKPMRILASDREVTRLGESVFRTGSVSEEALKATCAVLERMAERYRKLEVAGVRAVATSAIRDARNQSGFVERTSEAAGTAVEIISGGEEARLIHLGVESNWPQGGKRILIFDIGGGSAEIIAARRGHMEEAFSMPLGAIRLRESFLKTDPAPPLQLHQMREYIQEKLAIAVRRLGHDGWERAIATSATAAAVARAVSRVRRAKRDEIDRRRASSAQVRQLYRKLAERDLAGRRKVTGIGPRRAEIIVPGVAVLLELLNEFRLPAVYYSRAGVRDGVIADLAARNVEAQLTRLSRDERHDVEEMSRKYYVQPEHARKVAEIVSLLFIGLEPLHKMPHASGRLLEAAAYLLDVGHFISRANHHKHSYYVVSNSDMPGFTERERMLIACLCRYHRKSLPLPTHGPYQALTTEDRRVLMMLIPLLRLADNLIRSYGSPIRGVECQLRDGEVALQVQSNNDIDLERWGTERIAAVFRQVYERDLVVTRAKE